MNSQKILSRFLLHEFYARSWKEKSYNDNNNGNIHSDIPIRFSLAFCFIAYSLMVSVLLAYPS